MKKILVPLLIGLTAMALFVGCAVAPSLSVGGGSKTVGVKATVGQQLVDLKKAKDCGAITDQEYQAQKAKILQGN
jgi:hypothetical protein